MATDAAKTRLFVDKSDPNNPIGISLKNMMEVLGYYKRDKNGKRNLGMIIKNAEINPYARYKPEDIDSKAPITEAQRTANGYGFYNENPWIKAGYDTPQSSVYTYRRPQGGATSQYRATDFNGYFKLAASPLSLIFPQKVYIDRENGVSIRANDTGVPNYLEDYCVKLGEVMKASNDLYVALYIHKDSNNQWLLPTDVKVNDLSDETFPDICFAAEESMLPTATGIYNYIIPEIGDMKNQELTLIAVGVESLKYQTDKIPLKWHGGGNKEIGDRYLFSMELTKDADRVKRVVGVAKTLDKLAATLTMSGTVTKVTTGNATLNGRQAYWVKDLTSTLNVITPSDWMFTSQDTITLTAKVINNVGEMSKTDGTLVTTIEIPMAVTLKDVGATIPIKDLVSISNYNFNVWSGSNLSLNITIIATAENGETKTLISNYTFSQPLP